jgi:uncharacterized membrane protein YphA (DoxX/SURF4 family)
MIAQDAKQSEMMLDPLRASRLFFALTLLAIGLMGLLSGGFAPIWAGVPKSLPDRQLLAYACTFIALGCGAGLILKRTAASAALALLVYLIIWTLLFKGRFIIRQPLAEVSYQSFGENVVLIAAACVLYIQFATRATSRAARVGLRTARLIYGMALVAFGFSHFAYLNLTAPLVPAWLHGPVFWAYFTGLLYLATGVTLVIGFFARLGATVSAVQITLIILLVWGPLVVRGHLTASNWQETVVSWALTAGAWVIAASFAQAPWFDVLPFRWFAKRPLVRS